jgi:hypothetical protein
MDATTAKVMRACNNYFAVLCESVKGAETAGTAVKGAFKGKYAPGMLLRIHGAYTGGYGDYGEGELYKVVSFDGETLTLDHALHTILPNLFIAYCEPPSDFLDLCNEIAEWEEKAASRKGLASESIDGYSYSVATDPNGRTGYEAAFNDQLKEYRCARPTMLYYARNAEPWR